MSNVDPLCHLTSIWARFHQRQLRVNLVQLVCCQIICAIVENFQRAVFDEGGFFLAPPYVRNVIFIYYLILFLIEKQKVITKDNLQYNHLSQV